MLFPFKRATWRHSKTQKFPFHQILVQMTPNDRERRPISDKLTIVIHCRTSNRKMRINCLEMIVWMNKRSLLSCYCNFILSIPYRGECEVNKWKFLPVCRMWWIQTLQWLFGLEQSSSQIIAISHQRIIFNARSSTGADTTAHTRPPTHLSRFPLHNYIL